MKLSIITINYNNNSGLEKTIESIVNQTYKDFEYIIIDGNSSDDSVESIKKSASKINYWISEPDKGVYNAMNKGIKVAKGNYVIFMNSGDVFFDKKTLEIAANYFASEKDIYYGNALYYNDKGYERLENNPENLSFWHLKTFGINHQATFFKRILFEKIGFYNEQLKICSDWEFLLKALIKNQASYQKIQATICRYDFSGISANPANHTLYLAEKDSILKNTFSILYSDSFLLDEIHSKRFKQILHIKKHPISWKLFKPLISIFILFLPKNKKLNA